MNPMKFLFSIFLIAGGFQAAHAAEWIGPDEKVAGKYNVKQLEQLLELNKPALNENIKVVPLSRNARASNVLVQVRDREPLHRHIDSDITVFLLRGEGEMRLGKETRPVRAGDVIHIERGAIHAYINRGPEPAAALVVYSPAPGPKDRVLAEDK
ncbi:cupin [Sulfuricaulis limicola]|uniref:Cupin n=1 Tax=Sulfuricaulis limicola TaxID=1620215 RepID=A0A1B4XJ93_9GAMM|nr:cupin domain-containing protein [Sulfuricaulis limicola]BAV34864.1 cupin [Sulfuricaulis limicola]